jgi:hypothetical protein
MSLIHKRQERRERWHRMLHDMGEYALAYEAMTGALDPDFDSEFYAEELKRFEEEMA